MAPPTLSPCEPVRAGSLIDGSLMKVTTVSTTSTSAAPTVQPISRFVLPRICAATRPLR